MKYAKPPLSFSDQADLLLKRDRRADKDFLIFCLGGVNYCRLKSIRVMSFIHKMYLREG